MKRLLLVTNLFPRPDLPRCGVFNAHFAKALAGCLGKRQEGREENAPSTLHVLVPVSEWRMWRHAEIRAWTPPSELADLVPSAVSVQYLPVFYLPLVGRDLSGWFHRRAFQQRRMLFEQCDGVLGSWLYPDCVAAEAVAREIGKPFWARLHGTDRFHLDAQLRGAACRRVLDAAECVFVNAVRMSKELLQRGVSESKIVVARNGVNRDLFSPRELVDDEGAASGPHDEKTVLWVGNLTRIKGPDVALHAFAAAVLHRTYKAKLIIVGEGRMRSELETLARELGLLEHVTFLGSRSHQDVAQWMNRSACLLLSSRSEGMPNVVLEALASGTPVVATDVGDVPAVIHDGVNGRIVKANVDESVGLLAEALTDVLSRKWNVALLRDSVSEYDWQRSAQIVVDAMRSRS